ncbi:Protein T08H10.1 [Aphelenchoides avenae]|nr:Protein T08H10.1 [Aphelenchus avenae]
MVASTWLQPRWVGAVQLSNGVKLPLLGLGTWLANEPEELRKAIRTALDIGYRYFDTAEFYGNEHVLGEVLEEYYQARKLKRSDVFLTTKLNGNAHRPEYTREAIQGSLRALKTDYIDMMLIHVPMAFKRSADGGFETGEDGQWIADLVPHIDTWRAFEELYRAGVLRSLGVSNFNEKQLVDLYEKADVKPHNLQVEIHIHHPQHRLVNLCKRLGISVTGYSTLGSMGRKEVFGDGIPVADCLGHPLVRELARKYGKTPAQILIRHQMQRGISTIPKSTNPQRLRENFSVFDFKISDEDMHRFDEIQEDVRLLDYPQWAWHPWHPFAGVDAA